MTFGGAINPIAMIGDAVVVLLLLLSFVWGVHKGLVGILVGFLSGIITVIAASLLCAPVAALLGNTLKLAEPLRNAFAGWMNLDGEVFTTPVASLTEAQIQAALEGLKLPGFIANAVSGFVSTAVQTAPDTTLQIIILDNVVKIALIAISWITLFILFLIVFALLKKLAKGINNIPIIAPVNKTLGGVLTAGVCFAVICIAMYLFVLLAPTLPGGAVAYVENSTILGWMYHYNPLAVLLTKLFL